MTHISGSGSNQDRHQVSSQGSSHNSNQDGSHSDARSGGKHHMPHPLRHVQSMLHSPTIETLYSIEVRTTRLMTAFSRLKWKMAAAGILCGIVSGALVVCYRLGIEYGLKFATWMYAQIHQHWWLIIPWLVAAVAVGILNAWMVKREPMASGSGIPQTSGVVINGLPMKWQTILPVRFVGGLLGGLFGLSLGREGPSIQIGACGAQFVSHRVAFRHRGDLQEHVMVTAGAAAGLSAAFSAPLSGMMFALEGVHRSFSPVIMIGATAASLTADFISKTALGLTPVLDFIHMPQLALGHYWWMIPLGIIAGLLGSLTNRALLATQTLYNHIPAQLRCVIAILIALPIGLWMPQVLGGGSKLIELAELAHTSALTLLILLAFKLFFTCTSFGSGMPGGIFMPILAVGALGGGVCGALVHQFAGMSAEVIPLFAVCVMAGTLSSAVKTPITSILLTVEMTGTLVHMLPVAATAFIALLVSDVLKTKPVYAALLDRYLKAQGLQDHIQSAVGRGVMDFPVEVGSLADGKRVRDIAWPSGCLIVGLRRGESEIVPRGDTGLRAGDYLIVLFSGEEEQEVRKQMMHWTQSPQ